MLRGLLPRVTTRRPGSLPGRLDDEMITRPPSGGTIGKGRTMMAKKKATKKVAKRSSGKAADVLPGMPGKIVVMGLSTSQNKAIAEAMRKKLAGG